MRSHSNNTSNEKLSKHVKEKRSGDYFCAVVDVFECEECFVEPALFVPFDDAAFEVWVVWLAWDEDDFDREL